VQNACFSCVCSSNDEDSEHSFWEGVILLRSHSDVFVRRATKVLSTREIVGNHGVGLNSAVYPEHAVKTRADDWELV